MPRIYIVGCSGSGKTTLARRIQTEFECQRLELDGLFHQPNWTPLETDRFRELVAGFMDRHDHWVIDGNYRAVRDLVLGRATMVVWLDPSIIRATWRLGNRSLRRLVTRSVLWNGNRERFRDVCSLDPERSVLAWMWKTHGSFPARFEELRVDPSFRHLQLHRISNPADMGQVLEDVSSAFRR
jgi:adenylate kinase family enzyme